MQSIVKGEMRNIITLQIQLDATIIRNYCLTPWIQTSTGNGLGGKSLGAKIFKVKQSSDKRGGQLWGGRVTPSMQYCMQPGPSKKALRGWVQGVGSCGGCQRKASTGACANGMPRQIRFFWVWLPTTTPLVVVTTTVDADPVTTRHMHNATIIR